MDDLGIDRSRISIRSCVLNKLAADAVKESQEPTLVKLLKAIEIPKERTNVPMQGKEFEVLISLADGARSAVNLPRADLLSRQLYRYLLDSCNQKFTDSLAVRRGRIDPWQAMTRSLTSALITLQSMTDSIGLHFTFVSDYLHKVQEVFTEANTKNDSESVLMCVFSLQGFLVALGDSTESIPVSNLLEILEQLKLLLQSDFTTKLEGHLSSLRSDIQQLKNQGSLALRYFDQYADTELEPGSLLLNSFYAKFAIEACKTAVVEDRNDENIEMDGKKELEKEVNGHKEVNGKKELNGKTNEKREKLTKKETVSNRTLLDYLLDKSLKENLDSVERNLIKLLTSIATDLSIALDESTDYLQFKSSQTIGTAFEIKSSALELLGIAVFYNEYSFDDAISVVQATLDSESSSYSSSVVPSFKLGTYLASKDELIAGSLTRCYPRIVSSPFMSEYLVIEVTKSLVHGLMNLSQDTIVSLIYTLINMLTNEGEDHRRIMSPRRQRTFLSMDLLSLQSNTVSGNQSGVDINGQNEHYSTKSDMIVKNVISAVVNLSIEYDDRQISALTTTVLNQKVGKINKSVDHQVILGLADLAPSLPERDFRIILKSLLAGELIAFKSGDKDFIQIVQQARCKISSSLYQGHPLYWVYLTDLLISIINKGDVQHLEQHRSQTEITATAQEICALLPPLAQLLPKDPDPPLDVQDWTTLSLFRDIWFNFVVHGFAANIDLTKQHYNDLYLIARSTPPLVSEASANKVESELELNTVLRRGSSNRNVSNQKEVLSEALSARNIEVRTLSYAKIMFLAAANLLESIRVADGEFSKVMLYFGDPSFRKGDSSKYMTNIAIQTTKKYIANIVKGGKRQFDTASSSEQLKKALILCCHRVETIQEVAFGCCDLLISSVPSVLCRKASLYALLDLLSLLYKSILDAEMEEYDPQRTFVSNHSNIKLELSDSYERRQKTLTKLLRRARHWIGICLSSMNYEMKSLLIGYLSSSEAVLHSMNYVSLGSTVAMELGGSPDKSIGEVGALSSATVPTDSFAGFLSQYSWRTGSYQTRDSNESETVDTANELQKFENLFKNSENAPIDLSQLRRNLFQICNYLKNDVRESRLVQLAVQIPFRYFTGEHINLGISLWLWIMNEFPDLREIVLSSIAMQWEISVIERKGLYNREYDRPGPEMSKMEYGPSNKEEIDEESDLTLRNYAPHLELIYFFSSFLQSSVCDSKHVLSMFSRMAVVGLQNLKHASRHPMARLCRFELVKFGLDILDIHIRIHGHTTNALRTVVLSAALTWFEQRFQWSFGGNKIRLRKLIALLKNVASRVHGMEIPKDDSTGRELKKILLIFLNDELSRLSAWSDPLQLKNNYKDAFGKRKLDLSGNVTASNIQSAYNIAAPLAVFLTERDNDGQKNSKYLEKLVEQNPVEFHEIPESLQYYLESTTKYTADGKKGLRTPLLYWAQVSPIDSVNLFDPAHGNDSFILQYAMRSLQSHDVNNTFFYVPQIVQLLRSDNYGYVERYILQTAKISQLFCHQIIWNVLANSYKDEESQIPDPMKPTLDRVLDRMISAFSPEERDFYDREFGFFDNITSISGKLRPYIKKSKGEKKAKIDEEMDKIKLDVGVYLPSHPDGTVVDIGRRSGKPLQSHAKAPFLAMFKIRLDQHVHKPIDRAEDVDTDTNLQVNGKRESSKTKTVDIWQGAIFKVGDDCRQDVLALQIIAVFRSIFNASGLNLYVFPYRVTATAPGCGVIDVLPNSVSRDMLGREAVNGLYEYFTSTFGGEDSIAFQKARNNLVRSLAAYSVISYLIQFKDRHNGNIMYDNEGHILHVDFGFCFDIVPGGVKFEAAPFKLTHEMVAVMGGSTETQAYRWFEELCIKAFLASRPYCELFVNMVLPMLNSGLPCFKGMKTIKNLRSRFVLEKSEKDAALHFRGLIRKSYESVYTKGYDEFQRITNGIPY